jgi:hypothetical protein
MDDTSQNANTSGGGSPAASSSPAPAGKPTSASSALESAAARSAAQPASASGAKPNGQAGEVGQPSGTAAATAQPAQPSTGQPQAKGPIPFDAHETALRNARQKAADEAVREFAWAKGLDPNSVKRALSLVQRLDGDPRAFYAQLAAELQAQQGVQQDDGEFKLPEADLVSKDGRVKSYSSDAVAKIAMDIRNQVLREVKKELQPFQQEREAKAHQEKLNEYIEGGRKLIQQSIVHARTLPHFKEHEEAISKKLGEVPAEVRQQVGLVGAMYMAYSAVLAELLNKVPASAEAKVLDDLKRKAHAGNGAITPGGPSPAESKKRPQNAGELARHMEKLAASMTA